MVNPDIEIKLTQVEARFIIRLLRSTSGLKEELFLKGPSGEAVEALIQKLEAKL